MSQYGKVKQLIDTYSPTAEEEKMIVESWKKTWDEKILGPQQVKTQLKATLFIPQNMVSLENTYHVYSYKVQLVYNYYKMLFCERIENINISLG